ncbi:hypothetical protein N657DRAFT_690126 [Parathielavia appendiculata]|uniref:Uncharacterized protein n=1 Tax=Parathielavia appendiculata TaxID=2587402 RepID=A0AAN6U1E5_9PEZI|nr:hypothetical protein N657DRAFT_690126 [Parathielavia appendiculata]
MAQQPPFNSNNPFRRKAAGPPPAAPPLAVPPFDDLDAPSLTPVDVPSLLPSADRFRHQLQASSNPSQPPAATSFQKPKVVKRVRVQSPPPSSPESPGLSDRFHPVQLEDDESSSVDTDDQLDPFSYASSTGSADVSDRNEPQSVPAHRPPLNPFQKASKGSESGVIELERRSSTGPGTKGVLDVGAFGRLLLTGQAEAVGSSQGPAPYTQHTGLSSVPSGDDSSAADTANMPPQPMPNSLQAVEATPQTSRETDEAEDDQRGLLRTSQPGWQPAPSVPKKKPPPPSSRHGKLINPRADGETKEAAGGPHLLLPAPSRRSATKPPLSPNQRPPTPSDVNKPLPPVPHRSPAEEDTESLLDREATGKLPETDIQPGLNIIMTSKPPTPPNVSHAVKNPPATTAQPAKKPVPPPRRQPHGRSESKVTSSAAAATQHDEAESLQRRSSVDSTRSSTRSRSSSLRVSVHAPTPPPPRRPSHPTRAPSSHNLPQSTTSPGETGPPSVELSPSPSLLPHPLVTSPPPMTDNPGSSSSSTPGISTPTAIAVTTTITTTAKVIPPPPPPARNASVRTKKRPAAAGGSNGLPSQFPSPAPSSTSNAGLTRRLSGREPPPPPRHRDRGSSKGSLDGVGLGSAAAAAGGNSISYPGNAGAGTVASGDGGPVQVQVHDEHGPGHGVIAGDGYSQRDWEMVAGSEEGEAETKASSAAGDILADLSELQREVDALRGRYEKGANNEE